MAHGGGNDGEEGDGPPLSQGRRLGTREIRVEAPGFRVGARGYGYGAPFVSFERECSSAK